MLTRKNDIINALHKEYPQYTWQEIDTIYSFFWKEGVRASIKNLSHIDIFVPKLGSFKINKGKIDRLEQIAEENRYNVNEGIPEKVQNLKKLIQERYELKNTKREIRKQVIADMEKQAENNGGGLV